MIYEVLYKSHHEECIEDGTLYVKADSEAEAKVEALCKLSGSRSPDFDDSSIVWNGDWFYSIQSIKIAGTPKTLGEYLKRYPEHYDLPLTVMLKVALREASIQEERR